MINYLNEDKISRTHLLARMQEIMKGVDIPEVLHCINMVMDEDTLEDGFLLLAGGAPTRECDVMVMTVNGPIIKAHYSPAKGNFTSHESELFGDDTLNHCTITHYKIID